MTLLIDVSPIAIVLLRQECSPNLSSGFCQNVITFLFLGLILPKTLVLSLWEPDSVKRGLVNNISGA